MRCPGRGALSQQRGPLEWELLGLSPQGLSLAAGSSSVYGEVWGMGLPQRVPTAPGVLTAAGVEEGGLL